MKRKVEMRGGNGLTGRERDDDRRAAGTGAAGWGGGHKQWVSDGEELITNVSNLSKTEKREMHREKKADEDRLHWKKTGVTLTKEPPNLLPRSLNTPLPLVRHEEALNTDLVTLHLLNDKWRRPPFLVLRACFSVGVVSHAH